MKRYSYAGPAPLFRVGETVRLNREMYVLGEGWFSVVEVVIPKGASFTIRYRDWSIRNDTPIYTIQDSNSRIDGVPESWLEA